jgi:type IV pilus assembly protein PilQ
MIVKRILFSLYLAILLVFFTAGLVGTSGAQDPRSQVITDISVQEEGSTTRIKIDSNAPFSYTVYKPADPYRLIVELQEIGQGGFSDTIMVDRAGVMEIIPSKAEGAVSGVNLEIILTVPADIKPVQEGNSLILSFLNPEAGVAAAGLSEGEVKDAGLITDIELSKSQGMVYVSIYGDGRMYPEAFQTDEGKVIVDIPRVSTTVESVRTYEPPVMGVRVGKRPDKTRIIVDLAGSSQYDISSESNKVVLAFQVPEEIAETAEMGAAGLKRPQFQFDRKKYTGEVISLDIQDAPLSKIFNILADVSGFNVILSPQVQDQRVFIKLDNVPWDQALDVILRNYGLSRSVEGTIIRIAPTALIAQEEAQIAKAKQAALKAGDLETRMYPINFADVNELQRQIEDIMEEAGGDERGSVSIDSRTNTLIVRDVAQMHEEYERVINSLDTPTRQVSIEAKIVEVTKNFTQELGIQWGVLWQPTPQTTIAGTGTGAGVFTGNPLIVNLPAAAGAGSGAAAGLGYIGAENLRALDIQLSAMESSGKGKIISNPKIITLDNQKATIKQGKQIPYQTVSAEGTQTQFVSATLELNVTPHITPEGTIVMNIETKKNEADFGQTVAGVPTIDTNEATSQVLISDGDTLVMGGIFKTNISNSLATVPLLGRIPLLRWLFKTEKDIDTTSELLIFITPMVVK